MSLPPCVAPALGARVCEEARGGRRRASLAPELTEHLQACTSCRVAVERTARMAEAWRGAPPSSIEIASARARFLAARAGRRRVRAAPLLILAAALFLGSAAFAAARVASRRGSASLPRMAPALGVPSRTLALKRGASHARLEDRLRRCIEAVDVSSPSSDRAVDSAALPAAAPTAPPPVAPAATSRPARRPPAVVAAHAAHNEAEPAPATSAPPSNEWVRAAEAMRHRDYAGAAQAFESLSRTGRAQERDEARLALAQVRIAQGRGADARGDLADLAQHAVDAFVRQRAADALEKLARSSSSPRPGTNTP